MRKEVILTGLRPNNDLHLGNYFGALLPMIDMAKTRAEQFQVYLMVADLHSFVTPIDHTMLQQQIMHTVRLFAAAGLPLDDENIRIFRQSYVPAHSELTWILNNFTGMGEMERMTQFKDKSQKLSNERINVALLDYPVLQASDILLYGAKYVPVGDDQAQHLEFTRDIAERMNNKFGELFTLPEPVAKQHRFFGKEQGLRIKDLQDPSKKMSKSSQSDRGVIYLGDAPEDARQKVMKAVTDSLNSLDNVTADSQPGVYNLWQIAVLLAEFDQDKRGMANFQNYGGLKTLTAEVVYNFLKDFQSKIATDNEAKLLAKLEADEKHMNEIANETLLRVQKAVGLR